MSHQSGVGLLAQAQRSCVLRVRRTLVADGEGTNRPFAELVRNGEASERLLVRGPTVVQSPSAARGESRYRGSGTGARSPEALEIRFSGRRSV